MDLTAILSRHFFLTRTCYSVRFNISERLKTTISKRESCAVGVTKKKVIKPLNGACEMIQLVPPCRLIFSNETL